MKGKYKRFRSYCDACDKDAPAIGEKCSYCGNKRFGVKIKKPTQGEIRNNFHKYE